VATVCDYPTVSKRSPLTLQYSPSLRTSGHSRVVPIADVSRCSMYVNKAVLFDHAIGEHERDSRNGRYGMSCWSVRLRPGEFDDLGPLFSFVPNKLAKVGGRAGERSCSQVGKFSSHSTVG
jgi:hypothetical protein